MRDCKNEVFLLNLESFEWYILRVKGFIIEHRRNHMACVVNNVYIVMGGIDS